MTTTSTGKCFLTHRSWYGLALFRAFDRIAISKSTLVHIQYDEGPLSVPSESIAKLRASIRTYVDRIDQPGSADDQASRGRDTYEETKALVSSGRYALYSDDVAARLLCTW
jgi:hypothetical protein